MFLFRSATTTLQINCKCKCQRKKSSIGRPWMMFLSWACLFSFTVITNIHMMKLQFVESFVLLPVTSTTTTTSITSDDNRYHDNDVKYVMKRYGFPFLYQKQHRGATYLSSTSHSSSSQFSSSSSSSSSKYKVLFQKVVRPPPQLLKQKSKSSKVKDDSRILLFLPSLIEYIQSIYQLPRDLPMIYEKNLPDNIHNEYNDCHGSNDSHSCTDEDEGEASYSILEIKSPLVSKGDLRFHLYVEVVGIYTGTGGTDTAGTNANNDNVQVPTMAMVVIKTKENKKNKNPGSRDVIRQRLFQDSIEKIIHSLDAGLDSFAFGDIPLDIASIATASAGVDDTSNTSFHRSEGSLLGSTGAIDSKNDNWDDDDEDGGTWVGLDEYEGLSSGDTWEDIEPFLSSPLSPSSPSSEMRKNDAMTWDKDVVIDTVATTTRDNERISNNNDNSDDKTSNDDIRTNGVSPTTKTTTGDDKTDFAVQAAQEAMKTIMQERNNRNNDNNGGYGGDFAVESAKRAAAASQSRIEGQKGRKEQFIGDYAVESAKKIAQMNKSKDTNTAKKMSSPWSAKRKGTKESKGEERTVSLEPRPQPLSSPLFPTFAPTEPQITQGQNMNLEDMLPDLSPMITNGMTWRDQRNTGDIKPNSFRMSISNPESFSAKREQNRSRNGIKATTKVDVKQPPVDNSKVKDKSSNDNDNDEVHHRNHRQKQQQNQKKEQNNIRGDLNLNIVHDDKSIDPNQLSDNERKNAMNNLPIHSLSSSLTSATAVTATKNDETSDALSSPNIVKKREEIEQDIYRAALDLMPGGEGTSNVDNGISAEELLKDILKFGEEKEKEESDGSGFVDGALNKAKELVSLELQKNKQSQERGGDELEYKDTASVKEEELRRIFAAGQDIAEGRISIASSTSASASSQEAVADKSRAISQPRSDTVTNDYVDELIDADKTVPRNARSLDDELAELEVRISRSQADELDQGNNALFDVFSGPDNPNVDPETAVNWPGALPGTRTDIKLPPELDMAVKNARYAGTILSKIVEEDGSTKIFDEESGGSRNSMKKFFVDGKEISKDQIRKLQKCVEEGIAVGLIDNPFEYLREKSRLDMVVEELKNQPEERFGDITSHYKDLLLSENFVIILKEKLREMTTTEMELKQSGKDTDNIEAMHNRERKILERVIQYAQLLLKEVRALGAELEASQLEIIRSICQVAMDPTHETEEDTATALTDAVRDMKPLLDENFVAYLKYAISEEEGRLARAGLLDDPEHNRWLFVLKIVQEGVYAELSKGVQRYIDHISYVLRMETKEERKMLLSKLIDKMPSMDIRPFVKVVENISASLGAGRRGEFDNAVLGSMANRILQLRRDVHDLLPPDRIKILSRDADEWAARQKKKLLEQRGVSKQRLKAARESGGYDEEIGRREVERFD